MLVFLKAYIASFVSNEMAACRNRYNNKCAEVRSLAEKVASLESDLERVKEESSSEVQRSDLRADRLKVQLDLTLKTVEEKDLEIERLTNQITLTDMVVEQQYQIIKRDLEMRRLEHVDASMRTQLASAMSGQEPKERPRNGTDESDINYRPGR